MACSLRCDAVRSSPFKIVLDFLTKWFSARVMDLSLDHESMRVSDFARDATFTRRGNLHGPRLDTPELPFAIWRITPALEG
jgi:hypothetical protein